MQENVLHAKHFLVIILFKNSNNPELSVLFPILHMRQLNHRKPKYRVQRGMLLIFEQRLEPRADFKVCDACTMSCCLPC